MNSSKDPSSSPDCACSYLLVEDNENKGNVTSDELVAMAAVFKERFLGANVVTESEITALFEKGKMTFLKRMQVKYPWLASGFAALLTNRLSTARSVPQTKPLALLDREELNVIFDDYIYRLLLCSSSKVALEDWAQVNPAIQEICVQEHLWFPLFVEEIGKGLILSNFRSHISHGMKLRLVGGVLLSYVDLVSDLYMAYQFSEDGEFIFSRATIGLSCLCLTVQCLFVAVQNHKIPAVMAKEIFYTLTFMKPVIDVHRVISGQQRLPGQVSSPLKEVYASKLVEIVFEAIPAAIIQTTALFSSLENTANFLVLV